MLDIETRVSRRSPHVEVPLAGPMVERGLAFFAARQGELVSIRQFARELWGPNVAPTTIRNMIRRIRAYLAEHEPGARLVTVQMRGWRYERMP